MGLKDSGVEKEEDCPGCRCGGKHDMRIFRKKLKKLIPKGKLVIADRGFASSQPDEEMVSTPNILDSKQLAKYKSRARCCNETFNGRITHFAVLAGTFHHDDQKHKWAMEAVCVTVQYQMENGSPLFYV
jgi:hypothetical protein